MDLSINSVDVWTVDLYAVDAEYDATNNVIKVTSNKELATDVNGSDITITGSNAPAKGAIDTNGKVLNVSLDVSSNAFADSHGINIDGAVKDLDGNANKQVQIEFKTVSGKIVVDTINHNG